MARKEKELHQQLYPGWSARDNYAQHAKKKKRKREPSNGENRGRCQHWSGNICCCTDRVWVVTVRLFMLGDYILLSFCLDVLQNISTNINYKSCLGKVQFCMVKLYKMGIVYDFKSSVRNHI